MEHKAKNIYSHQR